MFSDACCLFVCLCVRACAREREREIAESCAMLMKWCEMDGI